MRVHFFPPSGDGEGERSRPSFPSSGLRSRSLSLDRRVSCHSFASGLCSRSWSILLVLWVFRSAKVGASIGLAWGLFSGGAFACDGTLALRGAVAACDAFSRDWVAKVRAWLCRCPFHPVAVLGLQFHSRGDVAAVAASWRPRRP